MSHDHSHHGHNHGIETVETTTMLPAQFDHVDHSQHDHSMHDHSAHADLNNGTATVVNHALHHMMEMAFHGGCNETILFTQWTINTCSGLVWSMLGIFLLGVIYEGLKYYRENLFWKSYNSLQYRAVSTPEKNGTPEIDNSRVVHMVGEVVHRNPPTIFSWMHFYQSFLHLVQVTLSLMLMLIFMTYNTWLCISVVFGAMVGYFLFGWKKAVVTDITEHCH